MVLKNKEIAKMEKKQLEEKLQELRFELMKSSVQANRSNSKTKEIKKAIARILTMIGAKEVTENKLTESKGKVRKK